MTNHQIFYAPRCCVALVVMLQCMLGCRATPPGGSPMQPAPLGQIVDEANRMQEDNAEAAKFIVYVHEFELNKPSHEAKMPWVDSEPEDLTAVTARREKLTPHGIRLNEYGVEHIERIANELLSGPSHSVVIERSESSKRWNTEQHFPVHMNHRLDDMRRQVVVDTLVALGVEHAGDLVLVAPAFPQGLHSTEAVQAFYRTRNNSNRGGASGGFGQGGIGL